MPRPTDGAKKAVPNPKKCKEWLIDDKQPLESTVRAIKATLFIIPSERDGLLMEMVNKIDSSLSEAIAKAGKPTEHHRIAYFALNACGDINELYQHMRAVTTSSEISPHKKEAYQAFCHLVNVLQLLTNALAKKAERDVRDFIAGCNDGR
ncbi:hypothetical protein [Vibrio phage vB_VhaS-a]|nr:hypothetical protein [Vibrio phage vB_VhaS-a]